LGKEQALRAKLFRALHAEGAKRGLDHDDLRGMFGVKSLSKVETHLLEQQLKAWTGKGLRRSMPLPRRGYAERSGEVQMAGLDEFKTLANAFSIAGMDGEAQKKFIARQLRGRDAIRTVADFHRVFSGLRAMNRRASA
jgi:hypothetical protein